MPSDGMQPFDNAEELEFEDFCESEHLAADLNADPDFSGCSDSLSEGVNLLAFYQAYKAGDVHPLVVEDLSPIDSSINTPRLFTPPMEKQERLRVHERDIYSVEVALINKYGDYLRENEDAIGFRISICEHGSPEDFEPEKAAILVMAKNYEQLKVVTDIATELAFEGPKTGELFHVMMQIAEHCEENGIETCELSSDFPLNIKYDRILDKTEQDTK